MCRTFAEAQLMSLLTWIDSKVCHLRLNDCEWQIGQIIIILEYRPVNNFGSHSVDLRECLAI